MVEMSELNGVQERKNLKSGIMLGIKSYMNGDIGSCGTKSRSDTVTSSESDSHLESILNQADKIQNGRLKEPPKKQVRFNMDGIEHFSYSYSYAGSSDEESSAKSDLLNNLNFADYGDDYDDDYSDDDDDDDEDEITDEGETSSEEGSSLSSFGYLVNKAMPQEINNNRTGSDASNGIQNGLDGVSGTGKLQSVGYKHQEVANSRVYEDKKLMDMEMQVVQLESALRTRKDSVTRHMGDLSERLKTEREKTRQEIDNLQTELENRRHNFMTEMDEMKTKREEQTKKFEEELEEFQNEKKLEERRHRYHEHEALISQKEEELIQRKKQALEQEVEVQDYEKYLNRRHTMCNTKEEDLNVLHNELEVLAKELESRKAQLQLKMRKLDPLVEEQSEDDRGIEAGTRRMSKNISRVMRGSDPRVEELKLQNRQLLDELFALKKAGEEKDDDMAELRGQLASTEYEKKRLTQKVIHLEYELELARKGAASYESPQSVDQIIRKASVSIRQARSSRVIRPSVMAGPQLSLSASTSSSSKHVRLLSPGSKFSNSSDSLTSSRGSKDSDLKSSNESGKGKAQTPPKDAKGKSVEGRHKRGSEKVTSALCLVM